MRRTLHLLFLCGLSLLLPATSWAFCGFYVAKAGTDLFNKSSQVALVRDGDRNIITMGSDYKGSAKDFAMVVPVPAVLQRSQIKVVNPAILDHLDNFTAPRLVEYFDDNPCAPIRPRPMMVPMKRAAMRPASPATRARELGVTIEARYKVEEYDVLILSAKESDGLITWLTETGYKIPKGANDVVGSYLKQGMKFFVAKVNLKEFSKTGFTKLRPLQVNYRHARFMLPIRLGTVNAQGKQDLFIYALTKNGRVETTNYRTVKLPSDVEIPPYIKTRAQFPKFYRDMFTNTANKENGKAVFFEYGWDMSSCDPCSAEPMKAQELKDLGVFWVKDTGWGGIDSGVFVTRLHVRYDRETFPEDLMFQATGNNEFFQGRYIVRHAWKPTGNEPANCPAAKTYLTQTLPKRQSEEAKNLANLTGWDITQIRQAQSKE